MNENNPHHRGARLYDLNIRLPVISTIRKQEARAVGDLIGKYAEAGCRALEVGPGTGYYTLMLARMFREVLVVEDSAQMAGLLRQKLSLAGATNVEVLNSDFHSLSLDGGFDVAVAVGVLDYVSDPKAFIERMCAAASRAVIFTVPQRGFWGACFAAGGRLRKIRVYRCQHCAPASWAPEWRCTTAEVGLKTLLTKGLTLVTALEAP